MSAIGIARIWSQWQQSDDAFPFFTEPASGVNTMADVPRGKYVGPE
jgi:hypothetical protein